jgi:hypothetical protein
MSRNSSKTCQCWINHYVNFWKRMSNSTGKVSTNNRLLIWKKTLPEAPVLKFFWSKQKCSFIGIFLLWGTRWMSVARTAYSICFKVFKQSREELRPNRERTFSRSFWMYIASSICIRETSTRAEWPQAIREFVPQDTFVWSTENSTYDVESSEIWLRSTLKSRKIIPCCWYFESCRRSSDTRWERLIRGIFCWKPTKKFRKFLTSQPGM